MGAPDAALGVYINDPERIRSVLEYYLARKLPEDWQCRELRGLYSVRDSRGKLTHRQRDFIGEARAWGRCFLLGLENQEKINLTFPWRLMELDCLAYRQEIEEISGRNWGAGESGRETGRLCRRSQKAGKRCAESGETGAESQGAEERCRLTRESSGRKQDVEESFEESGETGVESQTGEAAGWEMDDFMYRFGSADRVKPILNLVLYWGKKKWERPHSLREMMGDISDLPEELRQLAGDYKVHIIPMREIPEEALQEMDSDLKYVLGIMKRSHSSREYGAYIRENREYFSRIPRSALDVIDACTNLKGIWEHLRFVREEGKKEEETDMCYALTQMRREAKEEGIKEGIKEGKREGIKEGKKEGIKEGILRRLVTQVCKKRSLGQTLERIAEDLVEEISAIEPIYDTAGKYAPEYDPEAVLRELAVAAV